MLPLIIIFSEKNRKERNGIIIFSLCFIIYSIVERLPRLYKGFDFIESYWNWDGKLLGIVYGIICYFTLKRFFTKNIFF